MSEIEQYYNERKLTGCDFKDVPDPIVKIISESFGFMMWKINRACFIMEMNIDIKLRVN